MMWEAQTSGASLRYQQRYYMQILERLNLFSLSLYPPFGWGKRAGTGPVGDFFVPSLEKPW